MTFPSPAVSLAAIIVFFFHLVIISLGAYLYLFCRLFISDADDDVTRDCHSVFF